MYIGNIMLLVLNLPLIGLWVKVLKIPYGILFPLILFFCLIGAYSSNNSLVDVNVMIFFGLIGAWYLWVVPKGVPKERAKKLHDAFKAAMESPEYRDYYKKQGGVVHYMPPEALPAFLEKEGKSLKKIIDFSGIKPS